MKLNPGIVLQEISRLLLLYPELADDEQFRTDMVEAETSTDEFLSAIVRRINETKAMDAGLDAYRKELAERSARYDRRVEALRSLAMRVMDAAHLRKMELVEATLSIRTNPPKLVGSADPALLPDKLVKIERKENRGAIKQAIENGNSIDGYALSNAEPSLTIRVK